VEPTLLSFIGSGKSIGDWTSADGENPAFSGTVWPRLVNLGMGYPIVDTSCRLVIPWSLEFEVASRLEAVPGESACYGRGDFEL